MLESGRKVSFNADYYEDYVDCGDDDDGNDGNDEIEDLARGGEEDANAGESEKGGRKGDQPGDDDDDQGGNGCSL